MINLQETLEVAQSKNKFLELLDYTNKSLASIGFIHENQELSNNKLFILRNLLMHCGALSFDTTSEEMMSFIRSANGNLASFVISNANGALATSNNPSGVFWGATNVYLKQHFIPENLRDYHYLCVLFFETVYGNNDIMKYLRKVIAEKN